MHIEDNKDVDLKVERIEFLISVYFPNVLNDWKECVALAQSAAKIESQFKDEYRQGFHRGEFWLAKLSEAVNATQVKVEQTLAQLIASVAAIPER